MKNLKDFIINKIYCLNLAEVLARDIFMSKPVTRLLPCRGISQSYYLSCLVVFKFSFLSVAKIFMWSSPVISDPYHSRRGPKLLFLFLSIQIQRFSPKIPCPWSNNWKSLTSLPEE